MTDHPTTDSSLYHDTRRALIRRGVDPLTARQVTASFFEVPYFRTWADAVAEDSRLERAELAERLAAAAVSRWNAEAVQAYWATLDDRPLCDRNGPDDLIPEGDA